MNARVGKSGWVTVGTVSALVVFALTAGRACADGSVDKGYEARTISGWSVNVSQTLLASDRQATDKVLELLKGQLENIKRVVPQAALVKIQKVPLWISPEYPGVRPTAEYHPGAGWLRLHGRDPAMAKGVEFTNVRVFESECRRMPMMVLHELSHAYHDQVLGYNNREIRTAYDHAKAGGAYDRVERHFGDERKTFERAYALTNPQEYFAECSEAFFGVNDYFPFTRAELAKHDPEMTALLGKLWGTTLTAPDTPSNQPKEVDKSLLTLDRIFASGEFRGGRQQPIMWSTRKPVYFRWESAKEGGQQLLRCDPATSRTHVVITAKDLTPRGAKAPLPVDSFQFSADESKALIFTNSQRVWRQNTRGDYWFLDLASHELKKLGGEVVPSSLMFCKFSPDGARVAYVHKNNLYVQELAGMVVTPLTTDGSPKVINGTSDWVNEEELDIRDGYRWSPDGQSIAFWQFDLAGVREFYLLNTETKYPRPIPIPYPIVGEQNSATRLGVVGVAGGAVRWLDISGDPRNHYLPKMEWSPDGSKLLVQQFNRLQTKNRVLLADPKTGKTQDVFTETDAAWLENENPVRWIRQGAEFVWLSERDGWMHAYRVSCDGKTVTQITKGAFDVIAIEAVDTQNGWLYYAASPDNPTQRYLYRVRLDGTQAERITGLLYQHGWHTYDISPDASWAVHTYSSFTTPPEVSLIRLPKHEVVDVLVDNRALCEKLEALRKPTTEFFRVDIGDGIECDAWSIKPPNFDPAKKYPLFIYVYGEPHGPTVLDHWQGSRGLWHMMLAQQGYIVASVNNRGTMVPRGRAWRKVVHRQIGILAPEEQAKAVAQFLKRWPNADPGRVGIWGWSGGGSMSLNAILRYPDVYHTAIAVAPVANQLLYDTIYQERYMGLPGDNADGYKRGSPLTYANQLKGNLLLVHGTGDDNCHYIGSEMLMNALIANNKQFSVMPYPNRTHSISEGANTTRHLYGLFTRHLEQYLPAKPR